MRCRDWLVHFTALAEVFGDYEDLHPSAFECNPASISYPWNFFKTISIKMSIKSSSRMAMLKITKLFVDLCVIVGSTLAMVEIGFVAALLLL